MRYTEFRDQIQAALRHRPRGMTYRELKERLDLPYESPCQEWVKQLEEDIGLTRTKEEGRALIWKVPGKK